MVAIEMFDRILTNIRQGSKTPICYCLAVQKDAEFWGLKKLPVFWTKRAAKEAASELKKLTGIKFIVTEAWIRKKEKKS